MLRRLAIGFSFFCLYSFSHLAVGLPGFPARVISVTRAVAHSCSLVCFVTTMSDLQTVKVRPALATYPRAMSKSPSPGANRFNLYSTVRIEAPAGINVYACAGYLANPSLKKEGNHSTCRQQSYGRTGSVDRQSSPWTRRLAKFTRGDLPSALGMRRRSRCPTPRAIRNPTLCLMVQRSPYACRMSDGSCPTVIKRTIIHSGLRNKGIGG